MSRKRFGRVEMAGTDGGRYTVEGHAEIDRVATRGGVHEAAGMERLRTTDGEEVTALYGGGYEIVARGVRLTPIGPDAP
jgi:hypothetical protein